VVRRALEDLRARWQSSQTQDPGVFGSSQVIGGLGGGAFIIPVITDAFLRAQLDSPRGLLMAAAFGDHDSTADCQHSVDQIGAGYWLIPPDADRALAVRTSAAEVKSDASVLVAAIAQGRLYLAGWGDGRAYHIHASGRIDLLRPDSAAARLIEPGDGVLLCSPAACDKLDEYELALTMHSRGPEGAVKEIIETSLKRNARGPLVAVAFGPQRALANRLAYMNRKPGSNDMNGSANGVHADALHDAPKAQWETWAQQLAADMADVHGSGATLGLRDVPTTFSRIEVEDGSARWQRNESPTAGNPFDDVRAFADAMARYKLLEASSYVRLALQAAARPNSRVSAETLHQELAGRVSHADDAHGATHGAGRFELGHATSRGRLRDMNEDSLCALELDAPGKPALLAVADGMGGVEAGEVASALAIQRLSAEAQAFAATNSDPSFIGEWLGRAVSGINAAVVAEAAKRGHEMGTTLACALVVEGVANIANVGDSRIYVWRAGALSRLTKDHSLVQALVDAGVLGDDERYSHPQRNIVVRSLGEPRMGFSDEHEPVLLLRGDWLLLCSDGLWEMVRDDAIGDVLNRAPNAQVACDRLVDLANANGGEDNISVVIGRVV
jgi:protein phosphatase